MGAMAQETTSGFSAHSYLNENDALRIAVKACREDVLEPQFLGMGEHNLNYRFEVPSSGRRYVLRVNKVTQPFHDDQVAYEYEALLALEASGRTPKPMYLDNTESAPFEGAMVIGFCEGDQLDFDRLRPGDLRCAAQIMADVHAVRPTSECRLFHPKDPLKTLFEECVQRFELYRRSSSEDARITRWVERIFSAAEEVTRTTRPASARAHIINTEPLPSHFLIPERSARQAASASGTGRFCDEPGFFVDWERPVIGEVAQDVAYFVSPTTTFWDSEHLFPADEVQEFAEDYWLAVDGRFSRDGFDERFKAFLTMTVLRSATWCCRALVGLDTGTHVQMTDKARTKLPVYLSDEFMHMLVYDYLGLKKR